MRISDWSSDVCSSELDPEGTPPQPSPAFAGEGARSSRPWAAPTGKTGPGGSPPPLPDRAEGRIDPDQVDPRGASRQYAGTNQGCCMSIETTQTVPAGRPGPLPSAQPHPTSHHTAEPPPPGG